MEAKGGEQPQPMRQGAACCVLRLLLPPFQVLLQNMPCLVLQGFNINFVTWQHCGLGCAMYIPMVRPNPVS